MIIGPNKRRKRSGPRDIWCIGRDLFFGTEETYPVAHRYLEEQPNRCVTVFVPSSGIASVPIISIVSSTEVQQGEPMLRANFMELHPRDLIGPPSPKRTNHTIVIVQCL